MTTLIMKWVWSPGGAAAWMTHPSVRAIPAYLSDISMFVISAETGGICIAPLPAEEGAPIVPTMAMRPFFGIQPVLMGDQVT